MRGSKRVVGHGTSNEHASNEHALGARRRSSSSSSLGARVAFVVAVMASMAPMSPMFGVAHAQPKIELPVEPAPAVPAAPAAQTISDVEGEGPKPALPHAPAISLPRESQIEVPLLGTSPTPGAASIAAVAATAIGGYGELVVNAPVDTKDPVVVDLRRFVLFVGHNFTDRLRLYAELELEHAVTSSTDKGEMEVEQAFLDYLFIRGINLRAGLLIMPVGIVNQYHEPPMFNGADRPETDTRIIPSTWREVGAGLFGALGPVRYQAYFGTAFDAHRFNAEGLREGHQEGQLALGHDFGAALRLEFQPSPIIVVGASGYYGRAGQGDAKIGAVPVVMAEADARFRWKGIEARAQFANVWIGNTPELNTLLASMPDPANPLAPYQPVASQLRGGYVEAGYNLFQYVQTRYVSSLVAFARFERTNTQAEVQGGLAPAPGKDRQLVTAGLTLRPIAEVVVKVDYQRGWQYGGTPSVEWNQLNAGLGFMF